MDRILLSHGSGGRHTQELVRQLFARHFANPILEAYGDSAIVKSAGNHPRLAFTTDSYVVQPLEFPGGTIGSLAVCGTINDLAVAGAQPRWLSCGFIIEEGLEIALLERIVRSMADEARAARIDIVCGDTKVVECGMGFGLFINTAGVGIMVTEDELSPRRIRPGDRILINGPIADHGIAVLAARKDLPLSTPIKSDCAALNTLIQSLLDAAPNARCMRDPTRGGLASVLNEWIEDADYGIEIKEDAIPMHDATRAVCELLGFDPLTVANEGKVLAVVPPDVADAALTAMRAHPQGSEACEIGTVTTDRPGTVVLHTTIGTSRIVPMPSGELLPRIC